MPEASFSSRAKSGHRRWLSRASGKSGSSPGSVSTAAASIPAAAQLAPCPAAPRSYTVTWQPACASRQATPRPTTPAPMMMVFGRCDGTASDALMTDSLHRACPARFSGSDLSRLCAQATPRRRAAPQPHANFKPSPSAMQGFSAGPAPWPAAVRPRRELGNDYESFSEICRASSVPRAPLRNALPAWASSPQPRGRLWRPPFLSGGRLWRPPLSFQRREQLLLRRGIDDIALGVDDLSSLGEAMPRHGGDAVHRTIAVECRRVVSAALPRPRLGTGAALVAGFGRSREGKRSFVCHTLGNRQAAALFRAGFFRKFGYRRRAKASNDRTQGAGKMRLRLGAKMAALALGLAAAMPAVAADPTTDQFSAKVQGLAGKLAASGAGADLGTGDLKTEIQGFLEKLSATTNGIVQWDGSDSFDFRQDGAAVVGVVTNARFSIHEPQVSRVVFDRIEIRRDPVGDGGGAVKLAMVFPNQSTLTLEDGTETSFSLRDATASAVVEEPSGRVRETALSFAGARLEHKATGDWMSF